MAEVMGAGFLGLIKHVKDRRGKEFLAAMLEAGGEDLKKATSRKILTVGWYPYKPYTDFLKIIDQSMGMGDLTYCRELGRQAAERDLDTVYKMYKERMKPEQFIRDVNLIWKSYYKNAGKFEVMSPKPEQTILRIVDFKDMAPAHCRLMEGWMTEVMRLTGAKILDEIRETSCCSNGDPYHEFRGVWSM